MFQLNRNWLYVFQHCSDDVELCNITIIVFMMSDVCTILTLYKLWFTTTPSLTSLDDVLSLHTHCNALNCIILDHRVYY